ncbi:TIR domain-containing protein [Accumulibacter sp.]|uniref:TIR domain-containing protein n=1 Tax=Accumulibacter sp. TaxID=2053492 RepID=UPI0035B1AEB2
MQFDVFLSYRKTDDQGRSTRDSLLAREVFDFLGARGVRCFLAEESLASTGQAQYKQFIGQVLDEVAVLVVVATSPENIESAWVRYEWESFHTDILSGRQRGTLLSYLDGVEVRDLPRTLRQNQAIAHAEGALQTLFSYVAAALGLRQVEDMTRSGELAIGRLTRLTEIMAESRLLELEITAAMFGQLFDPEQGARLRRQISALQAILREARDGPGEARRPDAAKG